jgi:hypothetical protein
MTFGERSAFERRLANNEMQRTSHGPDEGSPLISVFYERREGWECGGCARSGPTFAQRPTETRARDCLHG